MTTSSDSMTMLAHVSNQWLANVWVVGRSPSPLPRGPPAGRCEYNVVESRSPNDVLVSSTLRDLVIGSGIEFEDRGTHELKGVPGDWRLFAVAS